MQPTSDYVILTRAVVYLLKYNRALLGICPLSVTRQSEQAHNIEMIFKLATAHQAYISLLMMPYSSDLTAVKGQGRR